MAYSITTHGSAIPTGVSSITQSVAVSTAGSSILVFAQAYDGTVSNTDISSVTYNGVALTRVDNAPNDSGSGSAASFYIQNVAAGTHNLVATFAGTCAGPTLAWTVVSGVATSGGADNHAFAGDTAFNASTGLSVSLTPVASGAFVWSASDVYSGSNLALGGTNQTLLDAYNGDYDGQAYVTNPVTGAVSCTWTNGTTSHGDIFVISLAPSGGTTKTITSTMSGSSSMTGAIADAETLSSAISGSSTLTAALSDKTTLSSSFSGSGSMAASILDKESIAATISGSSSAAAAISNTDVLSAAITGNSTLAAALKDSTALASAITGSSSMSAAMNDADSIVANLSGSSSMSAAIADTEIISSAITGTSSSTAVISNTDPIDSTIGGSSSLSATIIDNEAIAASLSGSSSMTATVSSGVTYTITASFTGASASTGAISDTEPMAATVTGASSFTAALQVIEALTASMVGNSSMGAVTTLKPLYVDTTYLRVTAPLDPSIVITTQASSLSIVQPATPRLTVQQASNSAEIITTPSDVQITIIES